MKLFSIESGIGRLITKLGQCILLSIYWVLFSLPIFTWGAASAALYTSCRKLLANEEGKLFSTFTSAFKSNFKQGSIVGSVTLVVLLVAVYCGLLMLGVNMFSDFIGSVIGIGYLLVVIAGIVWVNYMLAYMSRFEDDLKTVARNCIYLLLMYFGTTVRLAVQVLVLFLLLYFGNLLVFLPTLLMLLPCVYSMLTVRPLEKVFKVYIDKKEEPEAEAVQSEAEVDEVVEV